MIAFLLVGVDEYELELTDENYILRKAFTILTFLGM